MKKYFLFGAIFFVLMGSGVFLWTGHRFAFGEKGIPPQFTAWGTVFPSNADQVIPTGWVQRPPEDALNFPRAYWQEKVNRTMPALTPEQKELGYVVFARHYLELVYPETAPSSEELKTELQLFASPGEYEPATFSLRALKDLQGVKISITDLQGSDRSVIKNQNVDIRVVRFIPTKISGKNEYIIKPRFLEKRETVDIKAESSRQFWVTVYVPPNSQPGDYVGDVMVESENAPPTTLKLVLKVWPIKLETPPVYHFMYNRWWDEERFEKVLTDMKEHGMTSIQVISDWTYPEIKFDGERVVAASVDSPGLVKLMNAYQKVGLTGPIIYNVSNPGVAFGVGWEVVSKESPQDYEKRLEATTLKNDNYKVILAALAQGFAARGWPEIVFNVGGESDKDPLLVVLARHQMKLAREVAPGVRIYAEIILPENSEVFEPYADIRLFSGFMSTDSGAMERTKQGGRELWYNGGSWRYGMEPKADRVFRGLGVIKVGAKGASEWVYSFRGDHRWGPTPQDNDLVDYYMGPLLEYTYEAPDGPLPSLGWEGVREGVDDAKYVFTLSTLIKRARASVEGAALAKARESEAYLSDMNESLHMTGKGDGYHMREGADKLSAEALGEFRWGVAQRIIQLQGLLGGK